MENILILGAGLMQRPAILAAKKMGFRVALADGNPDAVCVPLADEFRPIDLKDSEGLIKFALELKKGGGLKAVFTAGTDFSTSVAAVAEKCSLYGHSLKSAVNASDKTIMRACFEKAGVPSPKFRKITAKDFDVAVSEDDLPLVVKPVDNMGGRGCRMVRSLKEFSPAIKNAVQNSRTSSAIIETYMEGPEFSIDSLVYDGKLVITGFADRHIKYPPYFIEVGHTMPTDCSYEQYCALVSAFALGIRSLGLTHGAAKADIKYTKDGPMIGEIAARLSGGYMSGWTYPYASDCDLTKEALILSCGLTPEYLESHKRPLDYIPLESQKNAPKPFELFDVPCVYTSAERAWISIPGTVSDVIGLDKASKVPFVKDVLPRAKAGSVVSFPRNNVEKCGNIISAAPAREDAVAAAEIAVSFITVRLMPNNPVTDSFLSGISEISEEGFPPSAYELDEKTSAELKKHKDRLGSIPADMPLKSALPNFLKEFAKKGVKDWNYLTIEQTLERFDLLCPKHRKFDTFRFWTRLLRGGIQGVLYEADSE
ncbi:ATP-grasp domain-containing protein [Treponema parvum]|uniref:ATP-grasp domain-containing protein n=1 Tax=Treponema parvum TaxID=138851 RepID=UPI001AEC5C17|nr:ATP-grasp domain-containing protein [Treponema parvum]QTQ16069.1 ATP-grasp domain-containing protein [Treponema parvum]